MEEQGWKPITQEDAKAVVRVAELWDRWRKLYLGGFLVFVVLLVTSVFVGTPALWMATFGAAAAWVGAFARWWRLHTEYERWTARFRPPAGETSPAQAAPALLPGQVDALPAPGPVLGDPIAVELVLKEARTWPTADGGTLRLGPGAVQVRFRFSRADEVADDGGSDKEYPLLTTWVADEQGAWWRTATFVDPDLLTGPLTMDGAHLATGRVRFWSDPPLAWVRAISDACLLSGVRQLLDSRERFQLRVGAEEVTMMLKYQGPRLDLGWRADKGVIVVRAADMYYEIWDGEEYRHGVDGVCFGYCLDPSTVLPLTSTEHHWTRWGEWEEDEQPATPVYQSMGGAAPS